MANERLAELARAAAKLGLLLDDAIAEKRDELRARLHLLAIPDEVLPERRLFAYLTTVLGHEPAAATVEAVTRKAREPKLNEHEIAQLQFAQLARCAVSGRRLKTVSAYHVDHRVPIV